MNPNRSWLIKMKKEKNFKMIFFSIKRNVNISRKIREISLLRKIAYESNFFYACDKLFPVYTCICTRTSKRCDSWNTHKSPIEKEIEKEYRAVVVAQRRGEVEKRNFLCFLLISNSRSSRNVEALVEKLVISSKFDSIMKGKGEGEGKRGYSCYKKGK